MDKKTFSPNGGYEAPDCMVTQTLACKIFCSSIDGLSYQDYDSDLGDL